VHGTWWEICSTICNQTHQQCSGQRWCWCRKVKVGRRELTLKVDRPETFRYRACMYAEWWLGEASDAEWLEFTPILLIHKVPVPNIGKPAQAFFYRTGPVNWRKVCIVSHDNYLFHSAWYLATPDQFRTQRYCCIYGLSPWRMALVGLLHNLSKMMVISSSAGDARLSWRCQLSAHACVHNIQDILRIPHI